MEDAHGDVLVFLHFPQEHWRKVCSTNPLERLNVTPRESLIDPIHKAPDQRGRHLPQRPSQWPPADFVYIRLVRRKLLEQQEG
jgi:hypothetical protein